VQKKNLAAHSARLTVRKKTGLLLKVIPQRFY
jgi:hypothetical protein